VLKEVTSTVAEDVSESMVTSIKTEYSDDWDKVDTSDCEKQKQAADSAAKASSQRRKSNGDAKSDDWDDWGE